MPPFRATLALLGAAGALALTHCRDAPTAPERARAETITATTLLRRIETLADDSTRGRLTPSPELDEAAAWAAAEFLSFGLKPGLPGTFIQTWALDTVASAPNVVAILDGSDPALREQYVLLVAHFDGLGVAAPVAGDSIYNGADDNASGAAAVLELARAFAGLAPGPRRSLIFLLVSGEEEGLLGSTWYAAHPAVPLERTVAALNLDMIGRNSRDSVLAAGAGLSSLGDVALRVAAAHPELAMHAVGFPGMLGGSDHIPFALSGVPALFFFAGLHPDYHRPSDEAAFVDAEKASRIARLVFYVALDVANTVARPTWSPGAQPAAFPGATAW